MSIKPAILISVIFVACLVSARAAEKRQRRIGYFWGDKCKPSNIIKLDADTKNIEIFIFACVGGAVVGIAVTFGHRVLPFVGGIVMWVLGDKLVDKSARLKYAKQRYPAAYAISAIIFSLWTTPSLRKPIPGMERSHFFPKKWGRIFANYTNKLNVSSVPVWYHNLTDRRLPRWAKNTVGLVFRAPPVVQVAVISLTRKSRVRQAVSNWFRRNRG